MEIMVEDEFNCSWEQTAATLVAELIPKMTQK